MHFNPVKVLLMYFAILFKIHSAHCAFSFPICSRVYIFFLSFFQDAPVIDLSFGSNLNPDNIAEGNDVYFECKIKANPEVYKVVWLHDVSCIFYF